MFTLHRRKGLEDTEGTGVRDNEGEKEREKRDELVKGGGMGEMRG